LKVWPNYESEYII